MYLRSQAHRVYHVRVSTPSLSPKELADLLERIAQHQDRAAFAELFAAFAPRVKGFLVRALRDTTVADELTQEVMVRVWRRAPSFDRSRGSASAWIFTIARNARIDHARRKRPDIDPSDATLVPDAAPRADELTGQLRRAGRVREALQELPEEQAQILVSAYFEGRSLREIAEGQGVPLGTVKSRVRLAMGRLRQALDTIQP